MLKPETNSKMRQQWPVYVIWKKVRLFIDKRATVNHKLEIRYSLWDKVKRVATIKTISYEESKRIFNELNHEK